MNVETRLGFVAVHSVGVNICRVLLLVRFIISTLGDASQLITGLIHIWIHFVIFDCVPFGARSHAFKLEEVCEFFFALEKARIFEKEHFPQAWQAKVWSVYTGLAAVGAGLTSHKLIVRIEPFFTRLHAAGLICLMFHSKKVIIGDDWTARIFETLFEGKSIQIWVFVGQIAIRALNDAFALFVVMPVILAVRNTSSPTPGIRA